MYIQLGKIHKEKILVLDDVARYMGDISIKPNGQYIGQCPCCYKKKHLYAKMEYSNKDGKKILLMYCQHCNAKYTDIIDAFRQMGAAHID